MVSSSGEQEGSGSSNCARSPLSRRQRRVRALSDTLAAEQDDWRRRNRAFHEADLAYLRFLIPENAQVLEIGCGGGDVLASLKPARGIGIDLSSQMIERASHAWPHLELHVANAEDPAELAMVDGVFDYILLSDTIGFLDDIEKTLSQLHRFATTRTRLVVSYHSPLWKPVLRLAERLALKMPQGDMNWLATNDICGLMEVAGWEPIRREWRQLLPLHALGIGNIVNRYIATLPGIRRLCLRNYVVARPGPVQSAGDSSPSATVVIPCRNERGNIGNVIGRLPAFSVNLEVIFVEGGSLDGTYEECLQIRDTHPTCNIKVMRQTGIGKGDAVRTAFEAASGDVLLILDADLTVPPEAIPMFYHAIASGSGELVNGTRLVYPMESGAMRPLNLAANRAFARIFSFLLNQRVTDTLCGTKALWKDDYERIVANRGYFGDFDPFGDFDLIFGAAKLDLKIIELPVRYVRRAYGETQIARFSDGWLLARMVLVAWRKLKAV